MQSQTQLVLMSENAEKRGQAYELVEKLQHRLSRMEFELTALAKDFNSSRGGSFEHAGLAGTAKNTVEETVEILNHQFEMLREMDEKRKQLEESMRTVVGGIRGQARR